MALTITDKDPKYLPAPKGERGMHATQAIQASQDDVTYTTLVEFDTAGLGAVGGVFAVFKNDATDYLVKLQVSMDKQTWVDVTAKKSDGTAQAAAEVTCTDNAFTYLLMLTTMPQALFRYWRLIGKCSAADAVALLVSACLK